VNPFNDPIFDDLPPPPVDPRTVLIACPAHDRRCDCSTINSMLNVLPHIARNPFFLTGSSDICLARNMIAHKFVQHSPYNWIVWVDSDIIFSPSDWMKLWEGPEDIVTAPYAKKVLGEMPTLYGLGFTRVHRSAYELIRDFVRPDGTELADRFYMESELIVNYHPVGVTGDSRYHGEDRGFFLLAALADIPHRLETRTHLRHVGPFEYGYPDQIADTAKPITGMASFVPENSGGAN
jgi:hypothetical protein